MKAKRQQNQKPQAIDKYSLARSPKEKKAKKASMTLKEELKQQTSKTMNRNPTLKNISTIKLNEIDQVANDEIKEQADDNELARDDESLGLVD